MEVKSNKQFQSQKDTSVKSSNISVFIRIRPFNQQENPDQSCIQFCEQQNIGICLKQSKESKDRQNVVNHTLNCSNTFIFDQIFTQERDQLQIYEKVGRSAIDTAFQGINATIFCYGQTSSGKTYTCVGSLEQKEKYGILPRIVLQTLSRIENNPKNIEAKMKISMVQIYNQKIKDLIDIQKQDLKIRANKKDGIFLQNVTQRYILSEKQAFDYLQKGIDNRSVNSTNMNALSSRSHMLFIITLNTHDLYTGLARTAKISLVDLAGSEKISKTGAQGKVLEEAKKINASLTALGKVINALSDSKSTHVPYRQSKLTRLLQESLGGNCLTNLIVNISPSTYNQSETLTSLRFGARAKSIKNQPKVNKSYTVNQLLGLLAKAQKTIKQQNQIINDIQKESRRPKRNGGFGALPVCSNLITMHLIPDDEDASDSQNTESEQSFNSINRIEYSQNSQSSYTYQFRSLASENMQTTDGHFQHPQPPEYEEQLNENMPKNNHLTNQCSRINQNKMKTSLPCFSKEKNFFKSSRKINKVTTLLPSNKQNSYQAQNSLQELEIHNSNKFMDKKQSKHIRKRSSSVQNWCQNSQKIKLQISTQTATFFQHKQNFSQSLYERPFKKSQDNRQLFLNSVAYENLAKIKQNLLGLKLKYLGEKQQNAINELVIQRKNQIISRYARNQNR